MTDLRTGARQAPRSRLLSWLGGFSAIEMMVILLIAIILAAIAIPTFLGARQRTWDRSHPPRTERRLCTVNAVTDEVISCEPRAAR